MRKIPTVFQRDPDDRKHVLPIVTPGCEWVLDGLGTCTAKYDGTCTMFDGDDWWARREVKPGKTPPPGWWEVDSDPATGKRVGWEPMDQSPFAAAFATASKPSSEGTYELVGPKVNANPHGLSTHLLLRHGIERVSFAPALLNFDGLRVLLTPYLATKGMGSWIEGYVWWHPDGQRLAKLKAKDFVA